MATKTFSSRADEKSLAFADALARQGYGMSFGQYCGTVLLDVIERTGKLPQLDAACDERKRQAASVIKGFSARVRHAEVGRMSDAEIRELIASRYE